MEYATLYDLIRYLTYGTKLHIGVISLGRAENEKTQLPHSHRIHAAAVCSRIKAMDGGYKRCFACRNAAIERVMREKRDFVGLCVYGVYEYMRPVILNGEVLFIIFIGNILTREGRQKLHEIGEDLPLDTMEQGFDMAKCRDLALIIEGYIHILMEKYKMRSEKTIIHQIKAYIAENLAYDFSVRELARFLNYNAVYVGRVFRQETGCTIQAYVNSKRIKKAAELLLSDINVISASQQAGFCNVTYFNRVFKKEMGMTPTAYKKQKKAGTE